MKLNELIHELIELGEDVCPCEVGIPCPYFDPDNNYLYCADECDCLEGVELCIRTILKNEKED